jgi:copper chaperone CopZ
MTLTSLTGAATRIAMALLPEGVHLWNTYHDDTYTTMTGADNSPTMNDDYKVNSYYYYTVQLDVPTMGCVACINAINSSIRQVSPLVVEGSSWLHHPDIQGGGRVSVTLAVATETELEPLIQQVQQSIANAGFDESRVVSVNKQSIQDGNNDDPSTNGSREAFHNTATVLSSQWYTPPLTQLELSVPNMSCGGCVAEVDAAARQASRHVVTVRARMNENNEGGHASITVRAPSVSEYESIVQHLQDSLDAAGFFDNEIQSNQFVVDVDDVVVATITWSIP